MALVENWSRACNIAPSGNVARVFHQAVAALRTGIRLDVSINSHSDTRSGHKSFAGRGPRWREFGLLLLVCLGLASCDSEGGRTRPDSTEVTVIHVAPNFGNLEFRRVERLEATLAYRTSSVFTWDSDTYTFNLDRTLPGFDTPIRLYSFEAELTEGNDHSILLTEANGWLQEFVVGAPASELSGTEAEIIIAHTAGRIGPVDFYLEPPGTELAAATPRGNLDFLEALPVATVTAGEYEVTLTEVGNSTNVLMASESFELVGNARTTLVILDGLTSASAAAVLASAGGADTALADRELRASIRAINAMTSRDALDVTVDSNFSPPLLPAVEFGVPTRYAQLARGSYNLTVSPAGNPGAIEIDQAFNALAGQQGTWFITGDPGALSAVYSSDSRRLVRDEATVTLYFGATVVSGVDVFIAAPDTDVNTILPTSSLSQTSVLGRVILGFGGYTITVREAGTQNIIAGPVPAGIGIEGNYGVLITNGATGSGVDITLLDAFN